MQISLDSIFKTNHALDKLYLFIGVFKFAFNESYLRIHEKYQTVFYLLLEYYDLRVSHDFLGLQFYAETLIW